MYTKKDMEQMLYDLLEDLVNKEQPHIIKESKEEPLTEYQKELLQSISENRVISRLDIPSTAIERIFGKPNGDLVDKLRILSEFVNNPTETSSAKMLWNMNILLNLKRYMKQHIDEPSSLGFEMEYFLASLVGGQVIPTSKGNAEGDVTDVVVGDTSFSLKTVKSASGISGSIKNLQNTLNNYKTLYYVIFQKESNDTIVFKNYPLKVEGEIRVDNVRALGLDIDERNIISGSGTQFKGKIKEMKAGIEIIGSVSISQIEKTANSLSDTFVKKNLETENQIIEARNQVKQFQKHLMKNPKEGQKNLNNAIKAMAEATTNINDIIGIKYNK